MSTNEVEMKLKLLEQIFASNSTFTYLRGNYLNVLGLIGNSLSIDDLQELIDNNVFISIMFSPGTHIKIKHDIPAKSGFIVIDYNHLKSLPQEQIVAIIYHEIGHALNPELKNDESEYAADDYAISKGFGEALKQSLSESIDNFPEEFDKPISYQRLVRIDMFLNE